MVKPVWQQKIIAKLEANPLKLAGKKVSLREITNYDCFHTTSE
jgi:hypothetical protein